MADLTEVYDALRRADAAGDKDAASKLASYIQSQSSTQGSKSLVDQIPDGMDPEKRKQELEGYKQKDQEKSSITDKLKGAGETGLSILTSIPAQVAGGVSALKEIATSGKYGTQEGVKSAEKAYAEGEKAFTYAPRTEEGKKYLEKTGETLSPLQAIAPHEAIVATAAAQPAIGAAGDLARSSVSKAAELPAKALSKITPKIDPQTLELAKKANEYGIPLRPDMLTNNKIMRMMGEASEKVPLSGSSEDARRVAFNRALIKSIGGDTKAERLTPDVYSAAMEKSGQGIGDIAKKYNIKFSKEKAQTLSSIVDESSKFDTEDVNRIIQNYKKEIDAKMQNGVMPGEAFRKLDSKIGKQIRQTNNGDLKNRLGELQESFRDALNETVSDTDRGALRAFRKQYANGKTLEPLVAKAETGNISPAGLMGRVTSDASGKAKMARGKAGELGDLARVGQRFLKEPNSSGTAERSLAYGLLGGGAYQNPAAAAGVYGAANLYNRLGPRIVQKTLGQRMGIPDIDKNLDDLMSR